MSILCSGYSRQCSSRIHVNQDKFGSIRINDFNNREITLAVVADGISMGYEGKYASYNTVLWLIEWAQRYFPANPFDIKSAASEIQNQMVRYNHTLNKFSERNSDKDTCSTVCGILTDEKELLVFNAGDSRLYELSPMGHIRCMTQDDKAEDGHSISMHIGGKNDNEVALTFGADDYHHNSRYVLCTDGFYKRTNFAELGRSIFNARGREETVNVIAGFSEGLVSQGETDDITALVVS